MTMNYKRFALTCLVIFVLSNGLGFLIHGVLLDSDYKALSQIYRSEADFNARLWIIWSANLLFSLGAVWIYSKGLEANRPWLGQGIRFGLALWVLASAPGFLIGYVISPVPKALTFKQLGLVLISNVIIGIVTAALSRGESAGEKVSSRVAHA